MSTTLCLGPGSSDLLPTHKMPSPLSSCPVLTVFLWSWIVDFSPLDTPAFSSPHALLPGSCPACCEKRCEDQADPRGGCFPGDSPRVSLPPSSKPVTFHQRFIVFTALRTVPCRLICLFACWLFVPFMKTQVPGAGPRLSYTVDPELNSDGRLVDDYRVTTWRTNPHTWNPILK